MLTRKQRWIADALDHGPKTAHGVDSWINSHHNTWEGYDALHSSLKRMEARGLVSRDGRPAVWSLTDAGKQELAA